MLLFTIISILAGPNKLTVLLEYIGISIAIGRVLNSTNSKYLTEALFAGP